MAKKSEEGITAKKENLVDWYSEVLQKAELADYAPVRGFMVIRPRAYNMWEKIQEYFNKVLEKKEVKNAYFPLLIPESFFKKEAQHAEGFSPELAYVNQTDEGEKLAIRPTSETIMYDSYSKWVRSWRDLPLKINQWCNVLRWEVKQTKPFLRTREFLWQEGHCVFEDEKGAEKNMNEMIKEYEKMAKDLLAIPVLVGRKSKAETFAGAKKTMTIEGLMPDGKALQMGTSHNLGQGFAKSFDVKFKGKDEKEYYCWQTSWGVSTRLLGAIIMVHGDDKGLVIPPKIAENKLVIVPILFDNTKEKVLNASIEIQKELKKFNPIFDEREDYSPGWKFNEWELKGIPLRIEIGPKDLEKKSVLVSKRNSKEKIELKIKDISKRIPEILDEMQSELYEKAKIFLEGSIEEAKTIEDLKKKINNKKIVKAYFEDSAEVEEKIKDFTEGATTRIVEDGKEGNCIITGKKVKTLGYFSRSY